MPICVLLGIKMKVVAPLGKRLVEKRWQCIDLRRGSQVGMQRQVFAFEFPDGRGVSGFGFRAPRIGSGVRLRGLGRRKTEKERQQQKPERATGAPAARVTSPYNT